MNEGQRLTFWFPRFLDGAAVGERWWAGLPSSVSTDQATRFARGSGHQRQYASLIHSGISSSQQTFVEEYLCAGPILGPVGGF